MLASCSDMNDNIKEYVERGEVDYIGKTDSVRTAGGRNRIQISWRVNKDPRIESAVIYWNDRADSAVFPIDRSKLVDDSIAVILNNIAEGMYVFSVYHTGQGHRSIVSEVSGTVYGDRYQSSISIRRMVDITAYVGGGEIDWSFANETVVKTVFVYDASSGKKDSVVVHPDSVKTVFGSYAMGGKYKAITYHAPEPNALDLFAVEDDEGQFPLFYLLDKTEWIPYASSSHTSENSIVSGLIDGDATTLWQSAFNQNYNMATKPLYVELDMLNEKQVNNVRVIKRGDTRELEVRVSLDKSNWTVAGTIVIDNADDSSLGILELEQPVRARYIRLYVTRSANADGRGGIYEIDIEGSNVDYSTVPAEFRYSREGWTVVSADSEMSDRADRVKENILDGKSNTFWVPDYRPSPRPLPPYWLIVDIAEAKEISKIVFYKRERNRDTRTVQYFIGPDPDVNAPTWHYISEILFQNDQDSWNTTVDDGGNVKVCDIPEGTLTTYGRYLKIYFPDTNNINEPHANTAEIYLYGRVK
jgi:hypothetical protein